MITIKGEKHQLIAASNIIIDKIKDDPQSTSCPNISYSGISGPIANANPTGSPYAAGSAALVDATHPAVAAMLGHYVIPGQHPTVLHAAVPTYSTSAYPTVSAGGTDFTTINAAMSTLGYTVGGVNGSALGIVPGIHSSLHAPTSATSLGVIQSGASFGGTVSPLPSSTPLLTATLPTDGALQAAVPSVPAAQTLSLHSNNYLAALAAAGYLTTSHPQILGTTSPLPASTGSISQQPPAAVTPTSLPMVATTPTPVLSAAAHPQSTVGVLSIEKSSDGQRETIELAIPENLIGAILGKAGRTLIEYQDRSGAKIQISKKGEYVVGTRNRKVAITGKPPCPQTAQFLITQRIQAAQAARAQQIKFM